MSGPLVIWHWELFTQQVNTYWLLFSWGPFGAFIRILHRGPLTIGSYHFVEVTSHRGVVLFGEKFSLLLAGSFVFPLSCSLIQPYSFNFRSILLRVRHQSLCPPNSCSHLPSFGCVSHWGESAPFFSPMRWGGAHCSSGTMFSSTDILPPQYPQRIYEFFVFSHVA